MPKLQTCCIFMALCVSVWSAAQAQGTLATVENAGSSPPGLVAPTPPDGLPEQAPTPAPTQELCRPTVEKAMAADMKALTAQSQKLELAEQVRLYTVSASLWTQAVAQCEGRAKDRAMRNLADNQQISAGLVEQLDAGPQCAAAHKDGVSLQELAVQALGERRWRDASVLFRKAEDTWDLAAERCTGAQRDVAARRRDQSELDGHNAEYCAPLFHQAREHNQKLRASSAAQSREDKQEALMVAETMWREALSQCKGSAAKDSASNNANALARERGTPFVARALPSTFATAGKPAPAPANPAPSNPVTANAAKTVAAPAALPGATSALTGAGLVSAFSAAFPSAPSKPLAQTGQAPLNPTVVAPNTAPSTQSALLPDDFTADGVRFSGKFVRDPGAATFSGTGKLAWANGDTFEGTLVKGVNQGKGLFIWANGQRYDGDWLNDRPVGQAKMQFANGNRYEGAVADGIPHGNGRMAYASGDSFVGSFTLGVPNGKGLYIWKNGQQFDGDWVQGSPKGQGKLSYVSGDVFEGTVENGVPNGVGRFLWTNGDQYMGQWKAGNKHGEGTFTWKNGDRWQGIYANDQQTADGDLIRH